ncbi:hypothetical protein ACFX12_021358 [Malus domestica]
MKTDELISIFDEVDNDGGGSEEGCGMRRGGKQAELQVVVGDASIHEGFLLRFSRQRLHLYSTEAPPLVSEQQLQLCHAIARTLLSDDAGEHHLKHACCCSTASPIQFLRYRFSRREARCLASLELVTMTTMIAKNFKRPPSND